MDRLKNRSTRTYPYVSRYSAFPYFYNTLDDKYIYGVTNHLNKSLPYTLHKLEDYDTLDLLANSYYGRPDLYWIIADFNDIIDPLMRLQDQFTELKIPSLNSIYFGDN